MNLQSNDISSWFDSLDDVEPEYTPIKVWNTLQFFRMRGKTSVLMAENIEPLRDLRYVVYSPREKRYYLKESREYTLNMLYLYKRDDTFSGEDTAVEQLRRYVNDCNVHLLLIPEQVEETRSMLARVYNSYYKDKGVLAYKTFIALLENSLKLEDYMDHGKSLVGFRTICNKYEQTITALWKTACNK